MVLSKTRIMNSFVFLTFISHMQARVSGSSSSSGVSAANPVPVFMLDYEQAMDHVQIYPNPFAKLTSARFADIVIDSNNRSAAVIIFVEETFSAEDISTKYNNHADGCPYKHLRDSLRASNDKVKYFPSVVEPYRKLKLIFPPKKDNVFFLSKRSKLQLQDNFKYIYIYFQDGAADSKADVLQRHDSIIKKVGDAVRQLILGPVVAYYTGKSNPIVVEKVEFVKSPTMVSADRPEIFFETTYALFRFSEITKATPTHVVNIINKPKVYAEYHRGDLFTVSLDFKEIDVIWSFRFLDDFWRIEKVTLNEGDEEVGITMLEALAPHNYSYYCPEPIVIINCRDKSTVTFQGAHIEARVDADNKFGPYFNPSYHCAPFVDSGIFAILMVTFMCSCIAIYGIMSMLDVSTNDRYDDPNGQPLFH